MPDPEQTPITPPPAAASVASLAAPAPSLVDQYDADPDEAPSEPAAPASAAARSPAAEPEARGPERERDPATGRYLPSTPEGPKHSQYMIGMATDLGIDPAEIAGMTPDTLEVAVYHLSKQQRTNQQWARDRENQREQSRDQATDRNLGNQAPGGGSAGNPTAEPASGPTPVPEDAYDLGALEQNGYAPELVGAMRKMADKLTGRIKQLEGEVGRLRQMETIRANETFAEKMDRLFAGDEGTFGKGEGRTLKEDGPELARRRAVLGVMQSIKSGTIEQKYDKAYELLYGTRTAPAADDALAMRQEEWRRGNVARPTQRTGAAEPAGVEKAKRSVASKLQEMNGAIESGEASAEDFLE